MASEAQGTARGVRFIGNTWDQALLSLPDNPTHCEFVSVGGKVGNVTLHMLQTDRVFLDVDGKIVEVPAEGGLSAYWLNDWLADAVQRIDQQGPFLTETLTFRVAQNGIAYDFKDDPTVAKAGPFHRLPKNMLSMTVRVEMNPGQPSRIAALSVDLVK